MHCVLSILSHILSVRDAHDYSFLGSHCRRTHAVPSTDCQISLLQTCFLFIFPFLCLLSFFFFKKKNLLCLFSMLFIVCVFCLFFLICFSCFFVRNKRLWFFCVFLSSHVLFFFFTFFPFGQVKGNARDGQSRHRPTNRNFRVCKVNLSTQKKSQPSSPPPSTATRKQTSHSTHLSWLPRPRFRTAARAR